MIAIIPARGGSKGLPRKNILEICGLPMIAYTIRSALEARCIDRVVVTTEDREIANIAKLNGAEIPFMRPKELATDTSSAVDVYIHAIDELSKTSKTMIDKFMVLLPTSPLRDSEDIDNAYTIFMKERADTLISVTAVEKPISWYLNLDDNNRIKNAGLSQLSGMNNRQVFSQLYVPNGAIYILDTKLLKEERTYYSNNTIPYIMEKEKSIDIDIGSDFILAEKLLRI